MMSVPIVTCHHMSRELTSWIRKARIAIHAEIRTQEETVSPLRPNMAAGVRRFLRAWANWGASSVMSAFGDVLSEKPIPSHGSGEFVVDNGAVFRSRETESHPIGNDSTAKDPILRVDFNRAFLSTRSCWSSRFRRSFRELRRSISETPQKACRSCAVGVKEI
jgi:hypothetical protein